jgi:hypothetical protein
MNSFKQYKRKGLSEMRQYIKGEDCSEISITDTDDPDSDLGMVARNPQNHKDQWYVARKYFEDNLELASDSEQSDRECVSNDLRKSAKCVFIAVNEDVAKDISDKLNIAADLIEELQDFAIWMAGCGYDFCQHDYYIEKRKLLTR